MSCKRDIQFKVRNYQVKEQIRTEVERSGCGNRTQFFNDLLDHFFSIPLFSGGNSKLKELKLCLSIYQQLPGAGILELANQTNRTFLQMAVYIFKVGYERISSGSLEPLVDIDCKKMPDEELVGNEVPAVSVSTIE